MRRRTQRLSQQVLQQEIQLQNMGRVVPEKPNPDTMAILPPSFCDASVISSSSSLASCLALPLALAAAGLVRLQRSGWEGRSGI